MEIKPLKPGNRETRPGDSIEFLIENNPECKKKLFGTLRSFDASKNYGAESLHRDLRFISMATELSDLIRIRSTPRISTKLIVDHLKSRFVHYGVPEKDIYTPSYTQVLEGVENEQYNLLVEFPPKEENAETIVISGHLDTIELTNGNPTEGSLSEDPADPNYFGNTRINIRPHENPEKRIYGFGTNDMKNIFAVMLQLAKENYFLSHPDKFDEENEWLEGLGPIANPELLENYFARIRQGDFLNRALTENKNRILFVGTSGEEKAGHDGVISLLNTAKLQERYRPLSTILRESSIWLIGEPSKGFADMHKGYSAANISFDKDASKDLSPVDSSLKLIRKLIECHNSHQGIIPYELKGKKFSEPKMNIGKVRGLFLEGSLERLANSQDSEYLKISVTGVESHSSKPEDGENAIYSAVEIDNGLKILYGDEVKVRAISGGANRNQLASNCDIILELPRSRYEEVIRGLDLLTNLQSAKFIKPESKIAYTKLSLEEFSREIYLVQNSIKGNSKTDYCEFDCDYRTVPGQDNFDKCLADISRRIGLNPKIRLDRDSYPLDSRVANLNDQVKEELVEITYRNILQGGGKNA